MSGSSLLSLWKDNGSELQPKSIRNIAVPSSGTAVVGTTTYNSKSIFISSSAWDTDDAVARTQIWEWQGVSTSGATPYGTLNLFYEDGIVSRTSLFSVNRFGNATVSAQMTAGKFVSTTGGFESGSATQDGGDIEIIKGAQTGDPQVTMSLSPDALGNFTLAADTGKITLAPTSGGVVVSETGGKTLTMLHDGTDAKITSSSGDLYLIPAAAALDVMVGDNTANYRLNLVGASGGSSLFSWRETSGSVRSQLTANYGFDQFAFYVSSSVGNQLILATDNATSKDYDHDSETDPALYIQSAVDPDTDNTEYIKLQYNSTTDKGVLKVGKGYLQISPTTNGEGLCFANNETTTSDATETSLIILTSQTDRAYHVTSYVVATETTDHDEVASYVIHGTFKNDGGTLTAIGVTSQVHEGEDTAGWDASYDVSGTDIRVRVTGAAGTDIRWHVTSQYTSIQ